MAKIDAILLDSGGRDCAVARALVDDTYNIIARLTYTYGGEVWQHRTDVPLGVTAIAVDDLGDHDEVYGHIGVLVERVIQKATELGVNVVIAGYREPWPMCEKQYMESGCNLVGPVVGYTDEQITQACVDNGIEYTQFVITVNGRDSTHSNVTT